MWPAGYVVSVVVVVIVYLHDKTNSVKGMNVREKIYIIYRIQFQSYIMQTRPQALTEVPELIV